MIYCLACSKENIHMFPKKQTLTQEAIFGKVRKFYCYVSNSFFLLPKHLTKKNPTKNQPVFFSKYFISVCIDHLRYGNFSCPAVLRQLKLI